MMLRKKAVHNLAHASDDLVAVLLEPLPGHSDREVVDVLTAQGARDVEILSPGFITAQVDRALLTIAEAVAFVHPKRRAGLR